jgi:hypothetical protein
MDDRCCWRLPNKQIERTAASALRLLAVPSSLRSSPPLICGVGQYACAEKEDGFWMRNPFLDRLASSPSRPVRWFTRRVSRLSRCRAVGSPAFAPQPLFQPTTSPANCPRVERLMLRSMVVVLHDADRFGLPEFCHRASSKHIVHAILPGPDQRGCSAFGKPQWAQIRMLALSMCRGPRLRTPTLFRPKPHALSSGFVFRSIMVAPQLCGSLWSASLWPPGVFEADRPHHA